MPWPPESEHQLAVGCPWLSKEFHFADFLVACGANCPLLHSTLTWGRRHAHLSSSHSPPPQPTLTPTPTQPYGGAPTLAMDWAGTSLLRRPPHILPVGLHPLATDGFGGVLLPARWRGPRWWRGRRTRCWPWTACTASCRPCSSTPPPRAPVWQPPTPFAPNHVVAPHHKPCCGCLR